MEIEKEPNTFTTFIEYKPLNSAYIKTLIDFYNTNIDNSDMFTYLNENQFLNIFKNLFNELNKYINYTLRLKDKDSIVTTKNNKLIINNYIDNVYTYRQPVILEILKCIEDYNLQDDNETIYYICFYLFKIFKANELENESNKYTIEYLITIFISLYNEFELAEEEKYDKFFKKSKYYLAYKYSNILNILKSGTLNNINFNDLKEYIITNFKKNLEDI